MIRSLLISICIGFLAFKAFAFEYHLTDCDYSLNLPETFEFEFTTRAQLNGHFGLVIDSEDLESAALTMRELMRNSSSNIEYRLMNITLDGRRVTFAKIVSGSLTRDEMSQIHQDFANIQRQLLQRNNLQLPASSWVLLESEQNIEGQIFVAAQLSQESESESDSDSEGIRIYVDAGRFRNNIQLPPSHAKVYAEVGIRSGPTTYSVSGQFEVSNFSLRNPAQVNISTMGAGVNFYLDL